MPRTFNEEKAREVVAAVERLKGSSSFRNLLKEMARRGIVKDNKTLRLYLNLLVAGKVLSVRMHDVGSVYPQQIYSLRSKRPIVWVGPGILRKHGLNWEIPLSDIRQISSDFDGLARSQILESGLMAALEDCLAYELHGRQRKHRDDLPCHCHDIDGESRPTLPDSTGRPNPCGENHAPSFQTSTGNRLFESHRFRRKRISHCPQSFPKNSQTVHPNRFLECC